MPQTILTLLDELFLLPRIQDVARSAGYVLEHIAHPEDLGVGGDPVERAIPLTEPLEGPEAVLVRRISAMRPGLILVDANVKSLPWARWIQVLKTSAATRRIPILVFGPHVETELFDKARNLGADVVVSRGAFNNRMVELIDKHSLPDRSLELVDACDGEIDEKALEGIHLHNQGEYLEAHELLEEAWMEVSEMEGYLYRALLQFTVAYLHLSHGNPRGAQKMLLRIHQWLDPLPETCRGVDVALLKNDVSALRNSLTADPPSTNLRPKRI
jgi:hypothetical protein